MVFKIGIVIIWCLIGVALIIFIWRRQDSVIKKKKAIVTHPNMVKIMDYFRRKKEFISKEEIAQLLNTSEYETDSYLRSLEAMGKIREVKTNYGEGYFSLVNDSSVINISDL